MDKPALLFAAGPSAMEERDKDPILGVVEAHRELLKKTKYTFWTVRTYSAKFPYEDPLLERCKHRISVGYIYDVLQHKIAYRVQIDYIRKYDKKMEESDKVFVPKWRLPYFHKKGQFYWIKMNDIVPLSQNYSATDFKKFSDGKPFKRPYVLNYDIAIDPEYR